MSSRELDRLIRKVPQEREAFRRFFEILESNTSTQPKYVTVNRLFDKLEPNSVYGLTQVITALLEAGLLEQVIRIQSPKTGGVIRDFNSIVEIPSTIHDKYSDSEIDVTPENMGVFYRLPTKQETSSHKWIIWNISKNSKKS